MLKQILRYIYYSFYDLIKIFINLKSKNNFIIIYPRIISLIIKKVLIYEKNNNKFFFQKIRNFSDLLTVYEIFSEEHYNLKNFSNYNNLKKYYEKIVELKKSPLIIDCGSNIGSSSEYFSKIFQNSKIISIEPDLDSMEFSKQNIDYQDSHLINKAINCENKRVNFLIDTNDNRASKVVNEGGKIIESITINELLDQFDEANYQPFLIKIDIEGFEKNLFSSNYEWINDFKIIIIELHDWMFLEKSNSFNFLNALTQTMKDKNKRDLLILGENLISIKNN